MRVSRKLLLVLLLVAALAMTAEVVDIALRWRLRHSLVGDWRQITNGKEVATWTFSEDGTLCIRSLDGTSADGRFKIARDFQIRWFPEYHMDSAPGLEPEYDAWIAQGPAFKVESTSKSGIRLKHYEWEYQFDSRHWETGWRIVVQRGFDGSEKAASGGQWLKNGKLVSIYRNVGRGNVALGGQDVLKSERFRPAGIVILQRVQSGL